MITDEQQAELNRLNKVVEDAIKTRTKWLDSQMESVAKYKVGDKIYNLGTACLLGTISKLYRFHAERNPFYDTSLSIEYEYCVDSNMFDNTSRQPGLSFGSLQEALEYQQNKTRSLLRL